MGHVLLLHRRHPRHSCNHDDDRKVDDNDDEEEEKEEDSDDASMRAMFSRCTAVMQVTPAFTMMTVTMMIMMMIVMTPARSQHF